MSKFKLINKNKKEHFLACFLKSEDQTYWCIYHMDDGGHKLIFTNNLNDLDKLENFSCVEVDSIKEHMNKNGFEIEPEDEFGEVIRFEKIPTIFEVFLQKVEKEKVCKIKFC